MSSGAISKKLRSYSLIELMVVVGIITLIGITSIPGIFNRNDRLSLDSSANQIRQIIIDAETRSKAPDKNDALNGAQIYQVTFGKFHQAVSDANLVLGGTIAANGISLEHGVAQCDTGDLQGGFATIRNFNLPRGIYISSFYPSSQLPTDDRAVIRFTIGQDGFQCGTYSNPGINSTKIYAGAWQGVKADNSATVSRYLVVTVSSQKVSDKRFVTVDRETGEVAVARSNPQSYFTPAYDVFGPRWSNVDPNNYTLSLTCSSTNSDLTITFPRALDRTTSAASAGDPNLLVTYDITWDTGSGPTPIVLDYFYNLSAGHETVSYHFQTDRFTVANQPHQVTLTTTAKDARGTAQPASDPDATLKQRVKVFTPSCGAVPSDPSADPVVPINPTDPGGTHNSCNPITQKLPSLKSRLAKLFINKAEAASTVAPCTAILEVPQ